MLPPNRIKSHTKNNQRSEKKTAPIHRNRSHDLGSREEAEEHRDRRVRKTNEIYKRSEDGTHVPRTPAEVVFDGIVAKAFVQEEGDGDHVGEEEGGDVYGHYGVECCGAADVDEGEEEGCECAD
jgi:hypothetical protein